MTVEKGKDGALAGKVNVSGEMPHTAPFKSLSFAGNKMNGTYQYPLGDGGEVVLEASFEGNTLAGTWLLHPEGQATEIAARGTWKVTRK